MLAALDKRRVSGTQRLPLTVLAVITGVLGALTALRAVGAVTVGVAPLFAGLPAQLY